jgi:uncharacterized small protein (DUF1192 family)
MRAFFVLHQAKQNRLYAMIDRRPDTPRRPKPAARRHLVMADYSALSLPELENRIAIVRDNIRQLIEQAAAVSGGQNEERNADRIAQQTEELEALVQERDGRKRG